MRLLHILLDLIYPPKCVFCGKLLTEHETDLCAKCRTEIPTVGQHIERGECYRECYSVYYYEGRVKESLRRFKFGGKSCYAASYSRFIAMELLRQRVEFDVLSWVPISEKRARERGYHQTMLMAQAVAKELGIEAVETLKKIKNNPAQSGLHGTAARKQNVAGVYEVTQPERFVGKTVLLIDDVITSGATLSEAARTLQHGGAKCILCATLAATRP